MIAAQGYEIESVPERGSSDLSRYFIATLPNGFADQPHKVIAGVYGTLTERRKRELVPLAPKSIAVKLRYGVAIGGEPVVVERATVQGVPKFTNQRPTQTWKQMRSGRLLDSFFLGQEAWEKAGDWEVWKAVADLCAEAKISHGEARKLNDVVAVAICARAGLDVSIAKLPSAPSVAKVASDDA